MKKFLISFLLVSLMFFNGNDKNNIHLIDANVYLATQEVTATSTVSATVGEETLYYDTLSEAISAAPTGELSSIKLLKNVELNSKITIKKDQKIEIDGNGFTITRGKVSDNWYLGNLFTISAGAELTLKNLTYDGGNEWTFDKEKYDAALAAYESVTDTNAFVTPIEGAPSATAVLISNSGVLNIENVIFKNHYSTSSGLISATAASTSTLKNTSVLHCAVVSNSAVLVYITGADAKFYIEEGTIVDGNYAGGNGGILKIYNSSQVIMNGGEIKNTTALNTNGVVAMTYGGQATFILNNGVISNNSGVYGKNNGRNAAIYVHSGSKFIMNNGRIENNTGRSVGGVDVAGHANSNVELNGGIIQNNNAIESSEKRKDVSIGNDYDLIIGKDMIINGNIQVYGDLVNNGIVNGDVTLDINESGEEKPLTGTGTINGDIVIYYDEKNPVSIDEDIVNGNLVFCETTTQVLLKFYYNGGVDLDGLTHHGLMSVNAGDAAIPMTVLKEGHTVEWYMDEELTEKWNNIALPNKSHLFAKWIPNEYTITWSVNGKNTTQILKYGEEIVLPKNPTKKGYVFTGWSNYTEGMTVPASDVTFIAEFSVENPNTGDNIFTYIIVGIGSLLALLLILFMKFKKKETIE